VAGVVTLLDVRSAPRSATTGGTAGPAALAALATVGTLCFVDVTAIRLVHAAPRSGGWHWALLAIATAGALATLLLIRPVVTAVRRGQQARKALELGDAVAARAYRSRSRNAAWVTIGSCAATLIATFFVVFLLANDHAVQRTFFAPEMISISWWEVTKAFEKNLFIAGVAEVIVLAWGLVVALARLAPGRAGRPIAMIATAYVDAFRAVPAIIVIYLVGFGLPLAGVPVLSSMSPTWAAIFALVLTYGAYVAEVYRAGIESIHPSQMAAARSLGLSYPATMRHVIVPQAVRRVIPPLLNDFIGLQKDTSLVTVIGTVDAFTQAKTYSSNYFNLSSVTVVAALFVLITIPQTRFVDRLLARDQRRLQAR
jgi:polar amino acid transport system permease protein